MAPRDPVDKQIQRMEERRFAGRCNDCISSIERADSLREIARLPSSLVLPFSLSESDIARDNLRQVQTRAEDRAKELIQEQLTQFARTGADQREMRRRTMLDTWANLTGPLAHLRAWAQNKLLILEQ